MFFSDHRTDLYAQIKRWNDDVASQTSSRGRGVHDMRLRQTPTRRTLADLSSNVQRPSQQIHTDLLESCQPPLKRRKTMEQTGQPKKRGRPTKQEQEARRQAAADDLIKNAPKLHPSQTSRPSSPRKEASPRKREAVQSVALPFKPDSVKFHHLALCNPPVTMHSMTELRQAGGIPPSVENLYNKLQAVPASAIPLQLKVWLQHGSTLPASLSHLLIICRKSLKKMSIHRERAEKPQKILSTRKKMSPCRLQQRSSNCSKKG